MEKQKVAEVLYRCSGNYKCYMLFIIPQGLDIRVGDDVDVTKFGITIEEWYEVILPQWMYGFTYETNLDHTLVEVLVIRDSKDDDVYVNDESR